MDLDGLKPAPMGAMRLERQQLQALIDVACDGVWVYRPNKLELFWSEALATLLGYDLAVDRDLPTFLDMAHPDDRKRHRDTVEHSRKAGDGGRYGIEARLMHKDGRSIWLASNGVWFGEPDDPDQTLIGMVRDISSRTNALDQRDAVKAQMTEFLEHVPAGCYIKDASGRYTYANQLIAEFLGTTVDAFVGSTHADYFDAALIETLEDSDARIFRTGEPTTWVGQLAPTHTSKRRQVWDTRFPLRTDDGVPLLGGVTVDLSSVYETERQLEVAKRLETIGLMAGGIAHDFNNLVFAISGNAEIALQHTAPEGQTAVRAILAATEHAADMCRQLLTVGGHAESRTEPVRIEQLIRDSSELLQMVLQQAQTLRLDCAGTTARVNVDAGLLRQVLINLVMNAKQASPRGAEITIGCDDTPFSQATTSTCRSHCWLPDAEARTVRIFVSDAGRGIDAEHLDHIFDPYFSQTDSGHGLGLASVLGAVKTSQGAIRVESAQGQGTRFEVFFGVAPSSASKPGMDSDDEGVLPGLQRRVMVIDDNSDIVAIVLTWLERLGAEVQPFTNSVEAAKVLRESIDDYDIIMTDLSMPEIGGLDIVRIVREQDPSKPVILASGYNDGGLANDDRVWLLSKPYSLSELKSTLQLIDSAAIRVS